MRAINSLRDLLHRINGRGYRAYKDIRGGWSANDFELYIDHVQGDPFAAPSQLRVRIDQRIAVFPEQVYGNKIRRIALQDFLIREFHKQLSSGQCGRSGSGKSGIVTIDVGGQEVLERTALLVTPDWVEVRIQVGLPARGRSVLGRVADQLLTEDLPELAFATLTWENLPQAELRAFVDCIENQTAIRAQLSERKLIAFVANDSILPRVSGACDRPLTEESTIAFKAPDSLTVEMELPNPITLNGELVRSISGLGVPEGITLIVGGGYHGKSTLLKALERGVYPHIPGDGREYVVTRADAVKIRAEDGRSVFRANLSSFVNNLPQGRSTGQFSSADASGSTSQAANIFEALEAGSQCLLLDEDTCATNFMIRDARMQKLVADEQEPITPFIDRIVPLSAEHGVSTVLVMGGCGDYFDLADCVIQMKDFVPFDVTANAKRVAAECPTNRDYARQAKLDLTSRRKISPRSFNPRKGRRDVKVDARGLETILYGETEISLRYVEQLLDASQTRAIANVILYASDELMSGPTGIVQILDALDEYIDRHGLDDLAPFGRDGEHPGNMARPRRFEIAAAINRARSLR